MNKLIIIIVSGIVIALVIAAFFGVQEINKVDKLNRCAEIIDDWNYCRPTLGEVNDYEFNQCLSKNKEIQQSAMRCIDEYNEMYVPENERVDWEEELRKIRSELPSNQKND